MPVVGDLRTKNMSIVGNIKKGNETTGFPAVQGTGTFTHLELFLLLLASSFSLCLLLCLWTTWKSAYEWHTACRWEYSEIVLPLWSRAQSPRQKCSACCHGCWWAVSCQWCSLEKRKPSDDPFGIPAHVAQTQSMSGARSFLDKLADHLSRSWLYQSPDGPSVSEKATRPSLRSSPPYSSNDSQEVDSGFRASEFRFFHHCEHDGVPITAFKEDLVYTERQKARFRERSEWQCHLEPVFEASQSFANKTVDSCNKSLTEHPASFIHSTRSFEQQAYDPVCETSLWVTVNIDDSEL
ncbi:uncharacterized protein [Littorina saxatilis]|uniref:uncharacterized protein n=1 Tax=Littorina saxatilis TaxID=31220 RepID=UPI0038B4DC0D